jgi:hypothetical protein
VPDLSQKRERAQLSIRETPYCMHLEAGCYLGFRRGSDTWLARYRDRAGKQHHKPLGPYLHMAVRLD